jgi:hypothetical protein
MKKLYFKSGNKSVSRIPFVSIIGFIALNKITDVPVNILIIINFIIHEDHEPDETDIGPIKNNITSNRATPKRTQEYFVLSLYWTI